MSENKLPDHTFLMDFGIKIGIGAVFFIIGFVINRIFSKKSQTQIKTIIKESHEKSTKEFTKILDATVKIYDENYSDPEKIRQIYITRAVLFNLRAIYRGGDSRMFPTQENRNLWLYQLKKCCELFDNKTKDLDSTYRLIESHPFKTVRAYTEKYDFPDSVIAGMTGNSAVVDKIFDTTKKFPQPFTAPFIPPNE